MEIKNLGIFNKTSFRHSQGTLGVYKTAKLPATTLALLFSIILSLILSFAFFPARTEAATLTRQLEIGMRGSDVAALQTYLAADSTIYPEGLMTGYFGPLTREAVKRFQARFGIPQVGRVGPQTLAAIGELTDTTRIIGTDRRAPAIYGPNVSTTNSSATLTWSTDQPASALVYYDISPLRIIEADSNDGITVSGMTNLVHTDLRTTHSATLTGLQSNTLYNYLIYVRDAFGNVSVTWPSSVRTN